MRLFAHHDADGKIRSLTWFNAPEGVSIMLTPGPGELVAEIEGHKLTGTVPSEKALRDIAKTYKVTEPLARRGLTKKKR
ncbi:MAG: hypothetical protein ACR2MF_11240 [Chthoniobacterales bacterium]